MTYTMPCWASMSGHSSDSSIWPTATRSRWPCIMRLNFARLVFSQSCSVLRSVVARRLPIIALMLSLRSDTSAPLHAGGEAGAAAAAQVGPLDLGGHVRGLHHERLAERPEAAAALVHGHAVGVLDPEVLR